MGIRKDKMKRKRGLKGSRRVKDKGRRQDRRRRASNAGRVSTNNGGKSRPGSWEEGNSSLEEGKIELGKKRLKMLGRKKKEQQQSVRKNEHKATQQMTSLILDHSATPQTALQSLTWNTKVFVRSDIHGLEFKVRKN